MKSTELRQLIRESINEYIREIDDAGNTAALEAKMNKTQEAIELREKKMKMEGLDEAYHDMLDKGKMKELSSEVKALKKSLAKYEKQLDKLKSKGTKVEKTEEKEIVDEVEIDETFPESGAQLEEDNLSGLEDDAEASMGDINEMDIYEILHMQKLAGIISETEYVDKVKKAKKKTKVKKALNENNYSDWWAKANDELGLDFDNDIYSYIDSYDEPWQGKFANEVVNINASNYEDFKNQVKQLYDELNPF